MAVVKACKGGSSLARALDYAAREGVTSGKDCPDNAREAREQMRATKEIYNQEGGRQYKHYIQSFSPEDKITPEKVNELGREWAEECFPGHEVFVGTHTDREHIHNHIVVNSVNFVNGKKLQVSAKDLERFKQENDRICRREGLSIPETGQRQKVTTWNMNKQKLLERINNGQNVKSYVLDTAVAVQTAAGKAGNKQEFIKQMKRMGYKVDWQDHRKNVTFQNRDGHKVRLKNLNKTFNVKIFTKEGLCFEFSRPEKQSSYSQTGAGAKRTGNGSPEQQRSSSGIGQIRARRIAPSGISAVNKSVGNIKRELQQLQARTGYGSQGNRQENTGNYPKQFKLREHDQERD